MFKIIVIVCLSLTFLNSTNFTIAQEIKQPIEDITIDDKALDLFVKVFPLYKESTEKMVTKQASFSELLESVQKNKAELDKLLAKYNTDLGSFSQLVHRVVLTFSRAQVKDKKIPATLFKKSNFGNIKDSEITAVINRLDEIEKILNDK